MIRTAAVTEIYLRFYPFNLVADLVDRRGFQGFYFDAMSCVGDTEFLHSVAARWPNLFLVKEGCRDRDAYHFRVIVIMIRHLD